MLLNFNSILFRCRIFKCYNISICKKEKLKDETSKKIVKPMEVNRNCIGFIYTSYLQSVVFVSGNNVLLFLGLSRLVSILNKYASSHDPWESNFRFLRHHHHSSKSPQFTYFATKPLCTMKFKVIFSYNCTYVQKFVKLLAKIIQNCRSSWRNFFVMLLKCLGFFII